MPEPSLSELTNINPEVPAPPVIDNREVVDNLNQNARYHAENVHRQYNEFLQNKNDLFKNLGDLQSLDVAPQDRPELNKQAADIFGEILKDPSVAMGGKGYDEIQAKLGTLRQNSVLSKQNKLDYDSDKLFMNKVPELYTDENQKKLQDNFNKPLGSRNSVQLALPTILDEKALFEGVLKDATHTYTDNVLDNGQHYIETGNEVNPKAIQGMMATALSGAKDKFGHSIRGAVEDNYNRLPDNIKTQYDKNGGVEKYWQDRVKQYTDAYLPEGSYTPTQQGNYRFGKNRVKDASYLEEAKLAQKTAQDAEENKIKRAELSLKWEELNVKKSQIQDSNTDDLSGADTVLNNAASAINNGKPVKVVQPDGSVKDEIRISDPNVLNKFSKLDKDGNMVNEPKGINYDPETNQVILLYGGDNKTGGIGTQDDPLRQIPMGQSVWLNVIANDAFKGKELGGINKNINRVIQANGNSLFKIAKKIKDNQDKQTQTQPTTPKVQAKPSAGANTIKTSKGIAIPVFK